MKSSVLMFGIPLAVALVLFLALYSWGSAAERRLGPVVFETVSEYSKIRVRERKGVRSLLFVGPDGSEQRQSQIDTNAPHTLKLSYARWMFSSLLLRHPQTRVLILGLGGGAMVHFIRHAMPETAIDAVEIDPQVVKVATEWFGLKPDPKVSVHTADAFDFMGRAPGPYDAIYMDTFLKPPEGAADKTKRLKHIAFLKDIKAQLKPGGVLAVNIIVSDGTSTEDVKSLREVFGSAFIFVVDHTANWVVVAYNGPKPPSQEAMQAQAQALRSKFPSLGLQELLATLRCEGSSGHP